MISLSLSLYRSLFRLDATMATTQKKTSLTRIIFHFFRILNTLQTRELTSIHIIERERERKKSPKRNFLDIFYFDIYIAAVRIELGPPHLISISFHLSSSPSSQNELEEEKHSSWLQPTKIPKNRGRHRERKKEKASIKANYEDFDIYICYNHFKYY